ncbi:MAG TPA: hypothetical protein VN026_02025 [Bacteroidia bacterium]|jgi:hypothetical protein|nr:hypothetical protein [Bacteroidia bacterium]
MKPFGIILLFVLFIGCNKQKQKAPDAFFIKPESITVAVTSASLQGTTNHKITDLWYYVNSQFKGAYPMGNMFPIPSTGPTQIIIKAGIKNNGISATRQPYEFYDAVTIDTSVMPGIIANRNFVFHYKTAANFRWLEDFEGFGTTSGISIKKSSNSDTMFNILNSSVPPYPSVYEGTKCFYFAVDDIKQIARFESTSDTYPLPKQGQPVYLEMNYKCTQAFDVGVFNGSTYQYVATVNTSQDWNKIYIQLSTGVSTLPTTTCGLFFSAFRDPTASTSQVWIDNIKIISY